MKVTDQVFVDTGAWVALALTRDPFHQQAKESWHRLRSDGVRLATSVPVVMETFTFLERNVDRNMALRWKDSLLDLERLRLLECTARDLNLSWRWFERRDLHKLSAVDATSFVLMAREKIRMAFAFDHHFASAGYRMVG